MISVVQQFPPDFKASVEQVAVKVAYFFGRLVQPEV